MKPQTNQPLYNLIRAYMRALGASHTTVVALKSYIDAVRRLQCGSKDFDLMLTGLNEVIKNTEPKIIPLVHLIEQFEAEMPPTAGMPLEKAKNQATEILARKLERIEADTAQVTLQCLNCIEPGDFIIAHSITAHIREALVRAHLELNRTFKVLVLKQDFFRTRELVNSLEQHQIEYLLIPEYNLSHYLQSTGKLFIGAVSVTSDQQAVTGIGTANVVSLCHWYHVPVYLFIESIKFAHKSLPDQHIFKEDQDWTEADFTFHMQTFSHDFIDLKLVDHLITENGEAAGSFERP
jgi:translation initiation factor eIF-2B subunit alpha